MSDVRPEHRRYASWLQACARLALAALVAAFAAGALGLVPTAVPLARMPEVWMQPARGHLALGALAAGDVLDIAAVALLSASTALALMAAIPAFRARRERAMALLGVVQVAIILAAAATACLRQFV